MEEISKMLGKVSTATSLEEERVILGLGIAFLVLCSVAVWYFGVVSGLSLSPDKFFLTPYLKFAYVSFIKPHTGIADGGQQSALESFYSAQVSST